MFRKLLSSYARDPVLFTACLFFALFWFGALRHQIAPYYNALVDHTGGGLAAASEMYHNVKLAIILMFE